jgi:Uma2 family endonuclease
MTRPTSPGVQAAGRGISYEEFLERYEGHCEWVDGEVVMMAAASSKHQRWVRFLGSTLGTFVEQRALGEVFVAPFQMKTAAELPGREPDLLFVATENLDRVKANHLAGPADLAIEIISPESRLRDRGAKLGEYELGGVREYWILDPDQQLADFHVLSTVGHYERRGFDASGTYRSAAVDGFWLREAWLRSEQPPPALGVLRELGVI